MDILNYLNLKTIPFYVNLVILLILIVITYIIDYLKITKLKKKVDDSDLVYLINRFKTPVNSDQLSDNTKPILNQIKFCNANRKKQEEDIPFSHM